MKKAYLALIAAFCLMVIVPMVVVAEEDDDDSSGSRRVSTQESIKDKIRADYENRQSSSREDVRNTAIKVASTTRSDNSGKGSIDDKMRKIPNMPNFSMKYPNWFGSTTLSTTTKAEFLSDLKRQREEKIRQVRLDIFMMQKKHLVEQLTRAIENLKQVRSRISDRIVKAEQSGRNMSEAKNLMTIANTKIGVAEQAIATLSAYNVASTTNTSASTTIDVTKARTHGQTAIKAVKDAKSALHAVVVAIAKNMGLKLGEKKDNGNATSTATTTPSTSPTTSPTATSTATTTEFVN